MIRLARPEDASPMLDIYAPFVRESAATFEYHVPTLKEFRLRIQFVLNEAPWLVFEYDGKIGGFAYSGKHREREGYRWTRETSIYLNGPFQKKRIGTALYTSLIEILRVQGYTTLLAGITLPNLPSERFHDKLGFRRVGVYHRVGFKNGEFHDAAWWELLINSVPGDPILHWNEISPEKWENAIAKGEGIIRESFNPGP